jgi:Tol biopolymer transport system component
VSTLRAGAVAAATVASMLVLAGQAQATYPGKNGAVAWEAYQSTHFPSTNPPSDAGLDAIKAPARTLTTCDGASGVLPCLLGAPSYSPDGGTVVVSRLTPVDVFNDKGDQGRLELVNAGGGNERVPQRMTADDEHPAFLPGGETLVFDGRSIGTARPSLYTVATRGAGLRRLLTNASYPAPCANGAIAFIRNGDLYLMSSSHRSIERLTFGGAGEPSCSPDARRIAFIRRHALYTLGTDGKRLQPVGRLDGDTPALAPDGRKIAFVTGFDAAHGPGEKLVVFDFARNRAISETELVESGFDDQTGDEFQGFVAGLAWQSKR